MHGEGKTRPVTAAQCFRQRERRRFPVAIAPAAVIVTASVELESVDPGARARSEEDTVVVVAEDIVARMADVDELPAGFPLP